MSIFLLLGIGLLIIVALCGYLIVKLRTNYWLKYLLIPAVLCYGLMIALNLKDVQGYPYDAYPKGTFFLVDFRSVGVDKERVIELWITHHGRSRLYVIPFDQKIEDALKNARRAEREGILTEFSFDKDSDDKDGHGESRGRHSLGHELGFRQLKAEDSMPPKNE